MNAERPLNIQGDGGAKIMPVTTEAPQHPDLGIYDENDRLKRVVLWGPVGTEAVLSQIYPADESLFYDFMNVGIARDEAAGFKTALETNGVQVHLMRDVLAQTLTPVENVTRDQLIQELLDRAKRIYGNYYYRDGKSKLDGQLPAGGIPKRLYDYTGPIVNLVEQDIKRYGLGRAVALNKFLSIDPAMPMGNAIYARDQMNVVLDTRFTSSMAKGIRRREVPMYEDLYRQLGVPPGVEMPKGETFEGGDVYIHNGIVYVGVGVRTTKGAAMHIYRTLKSQLDQLGFQFAIVEDVRINEKTPEEKQRFMHLDTFSNPISTTEIVVCEIEAKNRRVRTLSINHGQVVERDAGTFLDFLYKGNRVIRVPGEAQREFACNFLALDDQTILVADTGKTESKDAASQLESLGKTVIRIPLYESTRGFGATHCMTGQLRRITSERL